MTHMSENETLGSKLDAGGGRPAGFDYMKISLATAVIVTHSVSTSYGQAADGVMWDSAGRPFLRMVMPLFFGVSGFLVAASLDRCKTLIKFFGLRSIRIFPALSVEVALSAFIIGPLLTTYALRDYFTDKQFFSYMLNAIGEIHYRLPGLFADNPVPHTVNAQLWTIPYELYTYIAVGIVSVLGVRKHRIVGPIAIVGLTALHFLARMWKHDWVYVPFSGNVPGFALVISGLVGLTMYYYRYDIAHKWSTFVIALGLAIAGMSSSYGGEYAGALIVPYVAIFLGLLNPPRMFLVRDSDYSYGMYLYGFVVQQTFVAVYPDGRIWWVNAISCVIMSAALAAFSWHLIEKPAQRLKGPISRLEKWYLAMRAAPVKAQAT